ncbi:unnamed protein product [Larinioides sclopetarius]|uniref:Uncharacterized protein n=1 Tax=Larinioides sclopetarius TaxID=280406 RepID=A0AAV2BWW2_9ARAC
MCALNAVGRPQEAKVDAEYEWAFFKRSSMGSSLFLSCDFQEENLS